MVEGEDSSLDAGRGASSLRDDPCIRARRTGLQISGHIVHICNAMLLERKIVLCIHCLDIPFFFSRKGKGGMSLFTYLLSLLFCDKRNGVINRDHLSPSSPHLLRTMAKTRNAYRRAAKRRARGELESALRNTEPIQAANPTQPTAAQSPPSDQSPIPAAIPEAQPTQPEIRISPFRHVPVPCTSCRRWTSRYPEIVYKATNGNRMISYRGRQAQVPDTTAFGPYCDNCIHHEGWDSLPSNTQCSKCNTIFTDNWAEDQVSNIITRLGLEGGYMSICDDGNMRMNYMWMEAKGWEKCGLEVGMRVCNPCAEAAVASGALDSGRDDVEEYIRTHYVNGDED